MRLRNARVFSSVFLRSFYADMTLDEKSSYNFLFLLKTTCHISIEEPYKNKILERVLAFLVMRLQRSPQV
jgi:hypothetical protein